MHASRPSAQIENPVLRGFHPDPSICRVGDDYYVATSTFEWFPGVRLHHSRDLVHFRPVGHALTRRSQLDLSGSPRSGGVWAPCLSHDGERFHLVFTDVKTWGEGFNDGRNYVVTAPSIEGPWSDPLFLNASGFDPSLFHGRDGRKWLCNVRWDHRPGRNRFSGIQLQEFNLRRGLVGEPGIIFRGTALGLVEGPHVYFRGGLYYLVVAEGGTSWEHAVTVARAKRLEGPYEADPAGPLLTSAGRPELALQKAGHGALVETSDGQWYLAHLCGRPIGERRRCILGRETALQKVVWNDDGWPRLAHGGNEPRVRVDAPGCALHPGEPAPRRDDFDGTALGFDYQTLRTPADPSWLSLTERPGFLRLRGQGSPQSLHRQSLVARRLQSVRCRFETSLEFWPTSFQQMAGLLAFYDDENFYYLQVTHHETFGRSVTVLGCEHGKLFSPAEPIPLGSGSAQVFLRAEFEGEVLRFSWSSDGTEWASCGGELDATLLSDEGITSGHSFTGAFGALGCHDLTGAGVFADFDYFSYAEPDE